MIHIRRWQQEFESNSSYLMEMITTKLDRVASLDFNQSGKLIVGIDQNGRTLVTEVDKGQKPVYTASLESSRTISKDERD